MTDMRMRYRKQTVYAQLNLLDSHDVSRFRSLCRDEESFRLAVIFQMTFPGMPSVFYGDEVGLTGILEEEYRQPMPWDTLDESSPLFCYIRRQLPCAKRRLSCGEESTAPCWRNRAAECMAMKDIWRKKMAV